jgi:hypothetical protein
LKVEEISSTFFFICDLSFSFHSSPKKMPIFLAVMTSSPLTFHPLGDGSRFFQREVCDLAALQCHHAVESATAAKRTAAAPYRVASQRSNAVGVPPRWTMTQVRSRAIRIPVVRYIQPPPDQYRPNAAHRLHLPCAKRPAPRPAVCAFRNCEHAEFASTLCCGL